MRRANGFTIIELSVGLAMAGILAAVAIPNYIEYAKRGRRADGVAALTQIQLAQERWRANNATYTTDLNVLGASATSPAGHYTLAIVAANAAGFQATATATSSVQVQDTRCATLRITLAGGNLSYSSSDAANVNDNGGANRCWVR
ncbi:prepilin-type N-terminal cleavage/methylation domain-containing protein [Burkholderiales bacterium JOSHI_001]|nr:prepilin-type N-terminal cleavage/methylation domain-containing protein [Burkholderiales bacterium JOSHI_001]